MRWRRGYAVVAVTAVSAAIVTPVLAQLAFDSDDGLALGRWQNAVVQFAEDGRSATVVVVYDAGERDRAERIELRPEADDPGAMIEVALLLREAEDGLFDPMSDVRCVKARVRGLRSPGGPGVPLVDRNDEEVEGLGSPGAGFVLPPLSRCRTVDATVLDSS